MRPVTLTMAGFGTFADPVTVDFDGIDVFALVGPTGSGKSTVIDAICFALYGSIPRYEDVRVVAPAVHALATEAKVALEFELGGTRYVAARVVRRDAKGKASTREARLEVVGGDSLAGSVKEMPAAVQRLLGLDFEQFTRAVVLPQGDFARFLHDKPAARQDLLTHLLGLQVYERMMQQARARAVELEAAVAGDRARLVHLEGASAAAQAAAVTRADALRAARDRWRVAAPALIDQQTRADAADRERAGCAERNEILRGAAAPDDFAAVGDALAAADRAQTGARAAAEAATNALTVAEHALADAGDRDVTKQVVADRERLAAFGVDHAQAVARAAAVAATHAAAVGAANAADEHCEILRTANAAWVVRRHLDAGAPCPVCEQIVGEIPAGTEPAAWTDARDAARVARAEADGAATNAAEAGARATTLEEQIAELQLRLAGAPSAAAAARTLVGIEESAAAVKVAREAERVAREAEQAARRDTEALQARGRAVRDAYRATRDSFARVSLTPPVETEDLGADWERLLAWIDEESPRHRDAAAAAARSAEAARTELRDRIGAIAREATDLEIRIESDPTVDALIAAAGVEEERARELAGRVEGEIEERRRIEAVIGTRQSDAAVASTLAGLLDARHFEQWLVAEALTRLVEGGSARLRELSGGRFSFAFTEGARDLLVVDHGQGDERRSVRTLSGGETFQASLALALALSDELADLGAGASSRLESIFLDEGFGTLDAETLETVAATIENLGAADRMVGIVTHVPELAARMPVQFQVARHGRSATVTRVEA